MACSDNAATLHLNQITGEKLIKLDLCDGCANMFWRFAPGDAPTPPPMKDPAPAHGTLVQEFPKPDHRTLREECESDSRISRPQENLNQIGSVGFYATGYHDWKIPIQLALEYAANVVAEHSQQIVKAVLPSLKDARDRNAWSLVLEVSGFLRESFAEEEGKLASPRRFHLPGLARFHEWTVADLLSIYMESLHAERDLLKSVFIEQSADVLTALEWSELLAWAENMYGRVYPCEAYSAGSALLEPALDRVWQHRIQRDYAPNDVARRSSSAAAKGKVAA